MRDHLTTQMWRWPRGRRMNLNRLPAVAALAALALASPLAMPVLAQAPISYAAQVLTNNPWGYWRLNETADPSTGTLVAMDSSTNHLNGTYGTDIQNGFDSVQGPRPPAFPGFEANNFAVTGTAGDTNSYVAVPVGNLRTNTVTFTAWLYPSGAQINWTGILMERGATAPQVEAGIGFNDKGMLAYTWNGNSTWSFDSGLVIPLNQWSFVAVAIGPNQATFYLDYVDPTTGTNFYGSSVNATPQLVQDCGTNLWHICMDFTDGSRNFVGSIDEVAVFTQTLSSSQIAALFAAGLGISEVAPAISQAPAAKTVYAGRTVHFSAGVSGSPAPTLQWQVQLAGSSGFTDLTNSATVSGATNAVLVLSNLSLTNAGDYRVVASNPAGTATSAAATLTVLAAPTLTGYANAVYTNGPVVYWRLNEDYTQTNAVDLMGDMMGTYGAVADWGLDSPAGAIYGPISPAFPGFETTNSAVETSGDGVNPSWVTVPTPPLSTNAGTFIVWINPAIAPEPDYAGLFLVARDWTPPGLSFNTGGELGYHWNLDGTLTFQSGLVPPVAQWSMVALVIEPTMGTLYMGTGGVLTNVVNVVAHDVESGWGLNAQIGCDYGDTAEIFEGVIDEVAMFDKALSFDQINTLYGVALGKTLPAPPQFAVQPASSVLYAGFTATFTSIVTGRSPLSYQWNKGPVALTNGVNVSGATTNTLVLSNITAADAGTYTLVVTNSDGSATSSAVTLTVEPRSPAYVAAVLSLDPIAYWRFNEMNDPSTGTVVAYDYVGGFSGTYLAAAQDGFNGVAGPRPADGFAFFEPNNTALFTTGGLDQSWVTAPQPTLNANTATFTMWVYPEGAQTAWAGLFMNRSGDGEGVGYNDQSQLSYTWNDNSTWAYYSGLVIPSNQWSFLAVAIEPSQAILYLANTNGMKTATNAIAQSVEAWGGTATFGDDGGAGRVFNGILDEVALFNYTLSPQQVTNLFAGISVQPAPTLTITRAAGGQITISWQGAGTLQSAPALQAGGTVWTNVGTTNPMTVTPTGKAQFYRVTVP